MPRRSQSEKTVVILHLWNKLVHEARQPMVVTMDDVKAAIQYCNRTEGTSLSDANPANFLKDVVRGENASAMWPPELTAIRITGVQRPSRGRIFEFVPFAEGQTEPFPDLYRPNTLTRVQDVESLSLPLTSKALGRHDESWLIQVAVKLRLLEMHFATNSKLPISEITHLQTSVKLGNSEIDSLFLAQLDEPGGQALIVCEAKQQSQRILSDQIGEQVAAAAKSVTDAGVAITLVVPLGLKAVPPNGEVFIIEFKAVPLALALVPEDERLALEESASSLFRLRPPVLGIGHARPPRPRPSL